MTRSNIMSPGDSLLIDAKPILASMIAQLTPLVDLEWIADVPDKKDEYRGMIVLKTKGKRFVLANQLTEYGCKTLFITLLDVYKAGGLSPVITYCSFD